MAQRFKISLKSGSSFTTPWGRKFRPGVGVTLLAGDPQLEYFERSPRFDVAAVGPAPDDRRAGKVQAKAEPTPEPKVEPEAPTPVDDEPVVVDLDGLSRAKLMSRAKKLGITVKATSTKAELREALRIAAENENRPDGSE